MDIYKFNNRLVTIGGKFLSPEEYTVTVSTVQHGTVTAVPMSGLYGTSVTLSSVADSGYALDYYTVNGEMIAGDTFTLTGDVTVGASFVATSSRVGFVSGTCQYTSMSCPAYRLQFTVLPTGADNSQYGSCNNGIEINTGTGLFWVTDYNIDSSGNLTVSGRKAVNATSTSGSSSWPTLGSNTSLNYYYPFSVGGVSSEGHKYGIAVPSDAIATLVYYKNCVDTSVAGNTVQTNKTYTDVTSSTCAFINDTTTANAMWNLANDATATYTFSSSIVTYPFNTNRTIVVGSKNYLESL